MKNLFCLSLVILALLFGCDDKKRKQSTSEETKQISFTDSIESIVANYERRLDIKMKRKFYEPQKDYKITLQKYFEFGDTTKLVKFRNETLTKTSLDIIQYFFVNNSLVYIHDYKNDKKCNNDKNECIDEGKYYFSNGKLVKVLSRNAVGTKESVPVIEHSNFNEVLPSDSLMNNKKMILKEINELYSTLPYPKPKN